MQHEGGFMKYRPYSVSSGQIQVSVTSLEPHDHGIFEIEPFLLQNKYDTFNFSDIWHMGNRLNPKQMFERFGNTAGSGRGNAGAIVELNNEEMA